MKVIACFAATLDGKIASAQEPKARFGSKNDLAHLQRVRMQADAILVGGETFRMYPKRRVATDTTRIIPHVILTQRFNLPVEAPLFHETPDVPITVFSPHTPPDALVTQLPTHIQWQRLTTENLVSELISILKQQGIQTLLIEGGGQVMDLFLRAQALNELYLTICPLVLAGKDDPSLVSGLGFTIADAPRAEILSLTQQADELYLHLAFHYSSLEKA